MTTKKVPGRNGSRRSNWHDGLGGRRLTATGAGEGSERGAGKATTIRGECQESRAAELDSREVKHKQQLRHVLEQMEAIRSWMMRSMETEDEHVRRTHNQGELKLTKFSETEDIETIFEKMMKVQEESWVFPQLSEKAHAAMNAEDVTEVKTAI